jgi:hypothetical protein
LKLLNYLHHALSVQPAVFFQMLAHVAAFGGGHLAVGHAQEFAAAAVCQFCGRQVDYVIVRNPARASKNRMFDNSPMEKELLDCGAVTLTVPVLSEFVKLQLAKLEADHQRGIPFNEAIGNDSLGLDIMARGVLQDWLATMFNQYDQIAAKLLPAVEAATIKPKTAPPIGEPLSAKRGAKVNLTK